MPDRAAGRWRGWQRTLPVMRGVLPIERSRVPADVLAGFTLAALGIPEVLGYARIAGMPDSARTENVESPNTRIQRCSSA